LKNSFILKVLLLLAFSVFLSANEKWIAITPNEQTPKVKPKTQLDLNLSQVKPINQIIKQATIIKQIMDTTSKKEKQTSNDKNWFVLKNEVNK